MIISDLIQQSGAWLSSGEGENIVISSRVRLARNLRDAAFPDWAGDDEAERIWTDLRPILQDLESLTPSLGVSMGELNDLDKQILFERHLISRDHAEKGKGSGLVIRQDESVAIMVNEEDHLRLQSIRPGLDLLGTWETMDKVDTAIEEKVRYAFSPQLGYLTACPTNVGTGMRASVMLHLPGLVLMNEIGPIIKGMSKIGLAVRGLWGEGTEATGNMFQISNQITLGEREADILSNLEQIVTEIVEHEKNARARLMERRETVLRDHVGRAYGILSNCYILSSKEALDLFSGLRLGIELGILKDVDRRVVDELLLLTQPGHLQKLEGKELKARERDRARAELVRRKVTETKNRRRVRSRKTDE